MGKLKGHQGTGNKSTCLLNSKIRQCSRIHADNVASIHTGRYTVLRQLLTIHPTRRCLDIVIPLMQVYQAGQWVDRVAEASG